MRKVLAYKEARKSVVLPRSTERITLGSIVSLIITNITSSRNVVVVLAAYASDIVQRNFSFTSLGNQLTDSEEKGDYDIEHRSITTQESKEAVVSSDKIAPINSEDRAITMQESIKVGRLKNLFDGEKERKIVENIVSIILDETKKNVVFKNNTGSWEDDFKIVFEQLKSRQLGVFLETVISFDLIDIKMPDSVRKEITKRLKKFKNIKYNEQLISINFRKLLQEKQYDTLMRSLPKIKSSSQCSYSFRDTKSENYLQEKAGGPLRKRESMSKLI